MQRELSLFYRQIAVAYRAGLPLTQAVQMGAEACTIPALKQAASDVARRIREGNPLGPALAAHPKIFSELETALVSIGEENGQLDRNLLRLSERSEREHGARRRFLLALVYPACLLVAALFLPKLYIWVTVSLGAYLVSVFSTALPLVLVLLALWGGYRVLRTAYPEHFDRLLIEIPFLGPNLRKLALARFSDSLAVLYGAGVEIRKSVRLAIPTMGNRSLEKSCRGVEPALRNGETLGLALGTSRIFPKQMLNAVEVGEKTGELDQALGSLARLYQEEGDRAIEALLKLVPFVIYLIVALYVAIVVVSAYGTLFRQIGSAG